MTKPLLFSPITLRRTTFRNRATVAPMCQYSAIDGVANDWHLVHLGGFAKGGFGAVMTEAAAVRADGRITHGDLGIWSDAHAEAIRPIAAFVRSHGAAFGIQLAHAGRKASMQRPWFGNGPLGAEDAARGDLPWDIVGPTSTPIDEGWLTPKEMSPADIAELVAAFVAAAKRADAIGCDFVEIHGAHGYLIQTFLSPASNTRSDAYGGDLGGRMRFALETAEAVRAAWPDDKPLFFRISSVDGFDGGWSLEDSVALATALKPIGVDVIDCSSGGNKGRTAGSSGQLSARGYQIPYAAEIKAKTGVATQAVGMILDGPQAEAALQGGQADLIAIGREALFDPFWARHQAYAMGVDAFGDWPEQYGWWLARREASIKAIRAAEA